VDFAGDAVAVADPTAAARDRPTGHAHRRLGRCLGQIGHSKASEILPALFVERTPFLAHALQGNLQRPYAGRYVRDVLRDQA